MNDPVRYLKDNNEHYPILMADIDNVVASVEALRLEGEPGHALLEEVQEYIEHHQTYSGNAYKQLENDLDNLLDYLRPESDFAWKYSARFVMQEIVTHLELMAEE